MHICPLFVHSELLGVVICPFVASAIVVVYGLLWTKWTSSFCETCFFCPAERRRNEGNSLMHFSASFLYFCGTFSMFRYFFCNFVMRNALQYRGNPYICNRDSIIKRELVCFATCPTRPEGATTTQPRASEATPRVACRASGTRPVGATHPRLLPLQGELNNATCPQGVALGYGLACLSGRHTATRL